MGDIKLAEPMSLEVCQSELYSVLMRFLYALLFAIRRFKEYCTALPYLCDFALLVLQSRFCRSNWGYYCHGTEALVWET